MTQKDKIKQVFEDMTRFLKLDDNLGNRYAMNGYMNEVLKIINEDEVV